MSINHYYPIDILFILYVNTCFYGEQEMKFSSKKQSVESLNINLKHYKDIFIRHPVGNAIVRFTVHFLSNQLSSISDSFYNRILRKENKTKHLLLPFWGSKHS